MVQERLKNVKHVQATQRALLFCRMGLWSPGGNSSMVVTAGQSRSSSGKFGTSRLLHVHLLLFRKMDLWSVGVIRHMLVTAALFRSGLRIA